MLSSLLLSFDNSSSHSSFSLRVHLCCILLVTVHRCARLLLLDILHLSLLHLLVDLVVLLFDATTVRILVM